MIRIQAQLKINLDSCGDMQKGDTVNVDALKILPQGVLFRVVGVWKKPQWFHSDWFQEVVDKK